MTCRYSSELNEVQGMANLERARDEYESAAGAVEPMEQGTRYLNLRDCFYLSKLSRNGKPLQEKLSNFVAEITHETTKTDGASVRKYFTVAGHLGDGRPLSSVDVEAVEFDRMDWVTKLWGADAQICVGTKFKDHVAAAIKERSKPEPRTIYQHIGWIEETGAYFYLTSDGAIGAQGWDRRLETELPGGLSDFRLPPPCDTKLDLPSVMSAFDQLLPGSMALLLLGGAFRAVLSHFAPSTVSLFLQGTTGTRKSAIAGVLQSLFGPRFHGAHLPENWTSTDNAIEKKAYQAKDALFVVDDFVARGTQAEVSRLHGRAERVLRAQGNQSGRDRLTSKAEVRGAYHPRGLILATGEDIPNGHSLQARCIIVSLDKGAVDLEQLSTLQKLGEDGVLAQVMTEFVMDLAKCACDIELSSHLKDTEARCKEDLIDGGHARMPANLASLLCGLSMFLDFATRRGDLPEERAQALKAKASTAAQELCRIQITVDQEASDAQRLIDFIRTAVAMGHAHIANKDGEAPAAYQVLGWKRRAGGDRAGLEGQGARIGYIEDGFLYLEPKPSLAVVKDVSTRIGNHLGSSERAVTRALKEGGFLVDYDHDRCTKKVTLAGQRKSVLCLDVARVFEMAEGEPRAAEANAGKSDDSDTLPF